MSDINTGDFMFDLPKNRSSVIKVIGVGGGGSNAVSHMFEQGITGVDFVVCNTDAQALNNSVIPTRIQLGQAITEGLGAGSNPEVGEQAALESIEEIKSVLGNDTRMVFVTAGMGGGTGTGAAPVIAGIAKEMGALTVGIVTAPFYFEGKSRLEQAEKGIEKLRKNVDSLIVINNDKLRELYGNLGYKSGFAKADEVLTTAAKGIAEVITHHYTTNIDLRDAKTVLADSGTAIMGTGVASGEDKAKEAIIAALDSPLLNNNKITGAKNVLLLILSGHTEITMDEIGIINDYIQSEAGNNANIIMGIGEDLNLEDSISVTIVATGFPAEDQNYTGKEEQKIFHHLEEEQPLTKKLSIETPIPIRVKTVDWDKEEIKIKPELEAEIKPKIEIEEAEPKEIRFFLEEEEEETDFTSQTKLDDFEPRLKNEQPNLFNQLETKQTGFSQGQTNPFIKQNESSTDNNPPQDFFTNSEELSFEREKKSETVIFTLDKIEEEESQPLFDLPIENDKTKDPMNNSISESLNSTIEERRARLKQFNFKFKNTLSNSTIDEVENIPAYKRQGVELSERENNAPSDFIVGEDANNELKIRPNNFLHDNVD